MGMCSCIRSIVSQKKKRFVDGDFDLDLTYITPRWSHSVESPLIQSPCPPAGDPCLPLPLLLPRTVLSMFALKNPCTECPCLVSLLGYSSLRASLVRKARVGQ